MLVEREPSRAEVAAYTRASPERQPGEAERASNAAKNDHEPTRKHTKTRRIVRPGEPGKKRSPNLRPFSAPHLNMRQSRDHSSTNDRPSWFSCVFVWVRGQSLGPRFKPDTLRRSSAASPQGSTRLFAPLGLFLPAGSSPKGQVASS